MIDTWHVLGAGSLGGLWATRLHRAGVPVQVILRNPQRLADYRAAGGLSLTEAGVTAVYPVPAELPDAATPINRLLVACKAYDAQDAIAEVASRLVNGSQILLLQNGLGSQQAIAARWPGSRCIFVSSTEGAYRQADFRIVHAGQGQNWLGEPDHRNQPSWLADLVAAGIPHGWTEDIMGKLWRKLAINCAINPLTVLNDCRNGDLRAFPKQLHRLCNELAEVLRACDQGDAAYGLEGEVLSIIEATANNYSSMHQDVRNGRRTEVSFLLGQACLAAGQHDLHVPALFSLQQQLQAFLRAHGLPAD
ncbi:MULTISPECIES: putative 2-dehydropantoate 2-reductase [Pseudomonadaceae]|uniref:putative 2-dehydropantoate 2-reductase n=1 Tax=Pseudomonadaceae TaxID=135621 RepID=UPI0015E2789B|nr:MULTISPECIES: putative 2-dehydropantoate 2-reductase [Pseudomonadaceae]MBA1278309.1 putative 2-dehydropantoate 2-reductase [Stutzerimonas stutzeri]MBC8650477.1 putative 2-dehydropantoate 2-reductase [Pseudomonas sp. MT4]QXY93497.1 putative 2-dehydropantoate 2-reductase [Pseudomonas sp. MTM4]